MTTFADSGEGKGAKCTAAQLSPGPVLWTWVLCPPVAKVLTARTSDMCFYASQFGLCHDIFGKTLNTL